MFVRMSNALKFLRHSQYIWWNFLPARTLVQNFQSTGGALIAGKQQTPCCSFSGVCCLSTPTPILLCQYQQQQLCRHFFCATQLSTKTDAKGGSQRAPVAGSKTPAAGPKAPAAKQIEIQVLDTNGELRGTMTRRKADLIAKTENLKLVLINADSKPTPTYQLMTAQEYRLEQQRQNKAKQAEKQPAAKVIKMSATIAAHDLDTKISHVVDWVQNGHPVKFFINYSKNEQGAEVIFNKVVMATKEFATVQQARRTATDLSYILTPKRALPPNSSSSTETDSLSAKLPGAERVPKPFKLEELRKIRDTAKTEAKQNEKEQLKDA